MEASHRSSVRRLLLSAVPRSAIALALLPYTVHGQTARSTASELSSAMEEAKTSNLSLRDVEIIAKARAVNAIPTLEVRYSRAFPHRSGKSDWTAALSRIHSVDEGASCRHEYSNCLCAL